MPKATPKGAPKKAARAFTPAPAAPALAKPAKGAGGSLRGAAGHACPACEPGFGKRAGTPVPDPAKRRDQALRAVRTLLSYIGEDAGREGLQDTPERVLKAWEQSWGKGYREAPPTLRCFAEPNVDYSSMVVVRGISFYSTCEHHMAPFFGTADVAYIPSPTTGVLGLSKLARVVDHYARRLQVQERLTAQVADHLSQHISADVGVVMRATHFCMVSRGVQQPNTETVTSALRGDFLTDPSVKAEFFRLTMKEAR